MKKNLKDWWVKYKQKLIMISITIVFIILIIGYIFRGLAVMRSTNVEEDQESLEIAFAIPVMDSTAQISDDKLYKDRDNIVPTPAKDVNIAFDAIFTDKGSSSAPTELQHETSQAAAYSSPASTSPTSSLSEKERVQRELNAIYNADSHSSYATKNIINNTHKVDNEEVCPPTKEELLAKQKQLMETGFNSLSAPSSSKGAEMGGVNIASLQEIPAFIHGEQTVKTGTRLTLRLNAAIPLTNGQTIPRNTIVYAGVKIETNRVQIEITSIKHGAMIYSTPLTGYGEDGLSGLPVSIEDSQKVVGDASTSAVANVLDKQISSATRGLVGSVVRDISTVAKSKKEVYVSFINNQKIFLRPTQKRH